MFRSTMIQDADTGRNCRRMSIILSRIRRTSAASWPSSRECLATSTLARWLQSWDPVDQVAACTFAVLTALAAWRDHEWLAVCQLGVRCAGKSTFLDLLAGRKTVGEQKGEILFSGVRPTKAFLKRYTGAQICKISLQHSAMTLAFTATSARLTCWKVGKHYPVT